MDEYLAASFEIIDADTGNTVASFEDVHGAQMAVRGLVEQDPGEAEVLVIVAFDKAGIAVGSEPATNLLVS